MADAAAAVKREMSILQRMQLAFGSLMLILLLACLAFFWSQRLTASARSWTSHSYQVLLDLDALKQSIADQRLAIRDYLIGTADSAELKPYHAGTGAFDQQLETLRRLTADNPLEQSRVQELQTLMAQWRTQFAETELRLAADPATRDQAVSILSSDANHTAMNRILGVIADMDQTERDLLQQRQQTLARTMTRVRSGTLALLLLGLLTGLVAIRRTARGVTRPIVEMTGLMTRLAQDDHAIEVPYLQRGDEIGAIARALQVFKQMATDTYGHNWVKSRLTKISVDLQAANRLTEFGRELVGAVVPLCGAGVGMFHARRDDDTEFEVIGRYGCDGQIPAAGRGLVEQCADEALPIILDDIPAGYLHVKSGLGAAPPRQLLLLPAVVHERVIGVLELAVFATVTSMPRALLDELMPIVALSLENLQRALYTHELLAASTAQAEALRISEEALRSQQEELRATNEELQAKSKLLQEQAQRLRASEEELRVQAEELEVSNGELRQKSTILNQQHEALTALQRETMDKADALSRASQYKSEFLANMSHELRTPLNSLLILSKLLADNEAGHLDAEEVESARIIHESGSNLLRLINDILDLSKVEAGKMELLRDALPLRNFATRLQRTFGHVARDKQLAFDVSVADDLPETLVTDGARLEQVLNNLLGNAFKFTREGKVSLRVARADADDAQRAGLPPEQAVAFAVSDTGVGIPADKFEQVFRAFEQVDGTTSRQFGGTGLGLSIARSMAQLLGGDILLQSESERGSTFTVLLPMGDGAEAAAVRPAVAPGTMPAAHLAPPRATAEYAVVDDRGRLSAADAPSGTVILAIEDDPVFARVLVDMIRRKGFLALAAGDGEQGLALAGQYRPTGILLDVMLPVMDGYAVLDRLKADPATRHIPVHFVSATEDVARGLELGAVGFLTKPVTREALGEAFDRLLHFAPGTPRRVLVVDDDAGSRAAVRALVAGADVEVLEAGSGELALQQMAEQTFDCLILGLGLPGISGFEFLDQAAQRGPVPPVVVYSGRELTREESLRLRQYTDSIVIKGARSPERLFDEVSLFLHSIRASQPSAPSATEHQPEQALAGRTVLIVDDDMRNIFALSKVLRAKGLQVVMAQDGHKALRQLEENTRIELVLMDIMMPGMDGYQTMREIRQQPRLQRLPIIALTAKAMQGDREKCLDAGANDYLSKPVDVDKLLSMMRVYLGGV